MRRSLHVAFAASLALGAGSRAALADDGSGDDGDDGDGGDRDGWVALPGIGPWTADYVAMRALGHPDVFLPSDIGVRNAIAGLGHDPAGVIAGSDDWRPWRSYALMHLWNTLMPPIPDPTTSPAPKKED